MKMGMKGRGREDEGKKMWKRRKKITEAMEDILEEKQ